MSRSRGANCDRDFSSLESSGSVSDRGGRLDDKVSMGLPTARSADPLAEPMDDDCTDDTARVTQAGSGGEGAIAVAAAPSHTRDPSLQEPKRPFRPQSCRLCTHSHIFATRSGLNDHATMYHGSYYSAHGDCFVKIPAEDILVKRAKVKAGQMHHRHPTKAPSRFSSVKVSPSKSFLDAVRSGPGKVRVGTPASRPLVSPLCCTRSSQARRQVARMVQ